MTKLALAGGSSKGDGAAHLTGAQKGLLFLVSLDEHVATSVMSHLTPDEVRRLRQASDRLDEVQPAMIAAVHEEFAACLQGGVPTSLKGSGAYLRRLAGRALGEGKAAEVWRDEHPAQGSLAKLSSLDTSAVLGLIGPEHPQTIAVILSQLEPSCASQILGDMGSDRQAQIIIRMARLKSVPTSVIEEINAQFASEIAALGETKRSDVGGVKAAAELLKRMTGERTEALMEELQSLDEGVAKELGSSLFTFEDLLLIDGRGMQAVLKEVSTDQLIVALKTASDAIKEKVFGNISARAAMMMREEMELLGPVRVSEVEEAQQVVVEVALGLEREGKITIARASGGEYV